MRGDVDASVRVPVGVALSLIAAGWLAGCTSTPDKRGYIEEILRTRAPRLQPDERSSIAAAMVVAERRTEVDALLLLAMAEQESHFDPRARGRRGALGLLQVRPATAEAFAGQAGEVWRGPDALFEPSFNVVVGATYLAELQGEFGSWDLALTAYNRGPTSARLRAERSPSSGYAASVLRRFEEHRERWRGEGRP